MRTLLSAPTVPDLKSSDTHKDQSVYYFPMVCQGLEVIKDKCYDRLDTCYTGDELSYHMAFLLEDLKITGVTISDRLIPEVAKESLRRGDGGVNGDGTRPIVDVADCPMFRDLYTNYRQAIVQELP